MSSKRMASMSQDLSNLQTGAGNQPGVSGSQNIFEIQQAGAPPDQPKVTPAQDKDSIEKAGEIIASLYLPPSSSPLLYAPDPKNLVAIGQLELDKICLNILDSWSKNLQKIAEEKKEDDRRAELNPVLREIHNVGSLFLAIATIFVRAIFGTQAAEALQKTDNLSNEKSIAERLVSQLNQWSLNGVLNGYLLTIVDQLPSAAKLNEAEKNLLGKQIQAILYGSALAGIYKAKFEWITAEEFLNFLENPTILNDPNATLLAINLVNLLNELPDVERARSLKSLAIYINTNPDLPSLFSLGETTGVQLSILNSCRL